MHVWRGPGLCVRALCPTPNPIGQCPAWLRVSATWLICSERRRSTPSVTSWSAARVRVRGAQPRRAPTRTHTRWSLSRAEGRATRVERKICNSNSYGARARAPEKHTGPTSSLGFAMPPHGTSPCAVLCPIAGRLALPHASVLSGSARQQCAAAGCAPRAHAPTGHRHPRSLAVGAWPTGRARRGNAPVREPVPAGRPTLLTLRLVVLA